MDFTKTIKTLKLLSVAVLVGSASLSANAETITFYDEASGLYFGTTNEDNTCWVSAPTSGNYGFKDVVVPSTVTYNDVVYKVTSLTRSVFTSSYITSIIIPEGIITKIDDYTFNDCKYLKSVTLPEGITEIGYNAFCMNTSLKSINFPEGLTAIGTGAFSGCTSLTSISFPKSLISIGTEAFEGCKALETVNFQEGLTTIGARAFGWCEKLNNVILPESLTRLESTQAFYGCSSLDSIILPDNLTYLGDYSFAYCTSLKYVQFGSKLNAIGYNAFQNCSSLIGVTTSQFIGEEQNVLIIPDNIEYIHDNAFQNCTSLENVWIGDGCISVGKEAFSGDTGLITISSRNEVAPSLKYKNTFSNKTYENATLYIRAGEDVWNSYIDDSVNYWYLFLNRDNSTYGTDDGGIQVGVDEVADEEIAVTADGKAIEVTGYEGETSVYNVAGMRVYQGYDSRIELTNPGIYVVIVNDKPYKVAIK